MTTTTETTTEVVRDTRSSEARAKFDGDVLDYVVRANRQVTAPEIMEKIGGSPLQIRTSLARHIEAGRLAKTGVARGTKYYAPVADEVVT